ncbi:MAG: hypothetical protein JSR62_18640 [Nitrospira sp.]|nr:hypothetical protein [Nitrospira sp.]
MANAAHDTVQSLLAEAENRLWTSFTTSQSFKHSVLKGSDRESAVADFLRQRLPSRFAVTTGEVIDQGGRRSPQLDVVIYDGSAAAPILPADREGGAEIIGAEALLATIEVKSKLTRADIRQAVKSVKTLYSMRPFGNGWGIETHREVPFKTDGDFPRFFSSVLAFETDIASADWPSVEAGRVLAECRDTGIPYEWLNRVCVLDKGIVHPAAGQVILHDSERQSLGMWYFSLLNFLSRESARRRPFPWSSYEPLSGRRRVSIDSEEMNHDGRVEAAPPRTYSTSQRRRYRQGNSAR